MLWAVGLILKENLRHGADTSFPRGLRAVSVAKRELQDGGEKGRRWASHTARPKGRKDKYRSLRARSELFLFLFSCFGMLPFLS